MANDQTKKDFTDLFSTGTGQDVLTHLMGQFQVFSTSHAIGDSHQTSFHEGERNVVLYILSLCKPEIPTPAGFMDQQNDSITQFFNQGA